MTIEDRLYLLHEMRDIAEKILNICKIYQLTDIFRNQNQNTPFMMFQAVTK